MALGCTSTKRLSADEYLKQAPKICTEQIQAIVGLGPVDSGNAQSAAQAVEQVADIQTKALDELRGLKPPADLADDVDAWLEMVAETLAPQQKLADAIREGNQEAATAANRSASKAAQDADTAAKDLGLTQCTTGEATADVLETSSTTTVSTESTGPTESTRSPTATTVAP
jgi:hypothetical protein